MIKEYIKVKMGNGQIKKFYRIRTVYSSKIRIRKTKEEIKHLHKPWNKKVYFRVRPYTNQWGDKKFRMYMYSTDPDYMKGFKGNR